MPIARIPRLYHFCDSRNVPLIREHGGIYSAQRCEELGIEIPVPGGDAVSQQSDRARGIHRHVHLGFTTGHPMAYRAQEAGRIDRVVYVHVNRSVLGQPGVRFVPGMANTAGISFYTVQEALEQELIDFDVLYSWMNWKDPTVQEKRQRAEKYEVLVPDFIPIESIIYLPNG